LGKGSTFRVTFPVRVQESAEPSVEHSLPEEAEVEAITGISEANQPVPSNIDTTKPTILVVEDNHELQDYIRLILQDRYNVVTAENGQVALEVLHPSVHGTQFLANRTSDRHIKTMPHHSELNTENSILQTEGSALKTEASGLQTAGCHLILSDLMMPIMDGYQLLEKLKSNDTTRHIPVIMLTARAEQDGRLRALRIGVDDYLTKPFEEEELLVRIENLLTNSRNRFPAREYADHETPSTNIAQGTNGKSNISKKDRLWLETFESFVNKNIPNGLVSIPFLAKEFAMSESTLLRQLKRLTGLSPLQYIQEVRLNEARRLLENRAYNSIAQVASKVGYDDARTFARSFKQRFGKLPSELLEG
jgi:DNA-binding response OmpR family regulator